MLLQKRWVLCFLLSTVTVFASRHKAGIIHEDEYQVFDDTETEGGEDIWARLDDEIEAKEEEYSRGRRQTIINRADVESSESSSCPSKCSCPLTYEVHCTFRFLPKIPEDLPQDLVKLNLGYNKLSTLPSHVFDRFSSTLRFLHLHSNDIRSLSNSVFAKMSKVEVLRLSWNKITGIRKIALHGLHSVERLYLDNNKLSFIHPLALRGLVNLKFLQLDGNRLSRLHQDVFVTLGFQKYFKFSSIQYLYLSKNEFAHLPRHLFDHMRALKNVYLHGNKWECSCDLKWMKQWIEEEDKYRCKRNAWKPRAPQECAVCNWPPSLEGIRLQDVPRTNFTCKAPRFAVNMRSHAVYDGFDDVTDPDEISRYNEVILFRYSDFYSTRMNIRLDSHKRSVFHANCHLTRVPNVKVWENYEEGSTESLNVDPRSRSYTASFEAQMECSTEYPENSTTLQEILAPYLDREIIITSRGEKQGKPGEPLLVYSTSVSSPPDEEPTIPITGGSISSSSGFITSPSSKITFQSRYFSAEEGTLYMVFKTSFTHNHKPIPGQYSKQPWVLIKQPDATASNVEIVAEKQTATFKCKGVGQPKPKITWVLPSEQVLHSGETAGKFSVSKSGRLFIRRPTADESGIYRCIATVPELVKPEDTEFPSTSNAELTALRVVVFSRNEGSSESDMSKLEEQTVDVGGTWSSGCEVESLPNSTIGWIVPGYEVIQGQGKGRYARVTTTGKGKITVKGFEETDQGIYRCVAANSQGKAEYSVYVGLQNVNNEFIETIEIPEFGLSSNISQDVDLPPPPILKPIPEDAETPVTEKGYSGKTDSSARPIDSKTSDHRDAVPEIRNLSEKEEMAVTPPPIIKPLPDLEPHYSKDDIRSVLDQKIQISEESEPADRPEDEMSPDVLVVTPDISEVPVDTTTDSSSQQTKRSVSETEVEVLVLHGNMDRVDGPTILTSCGGKIFIPCLIIPTFPPAMVQWIIPDGSVIPTSSMRNSGNLVVFWNGTLVIKRSSPVYSGTYKCETSDPNNDAYMTSEVTVDCTPPQIVEPAESEMIVNYGKSVEVSCYAMSHPKPQSSWFSSSNEVLDQGNVLTINKAKKNETYVCVARNEYGTDNHTLQVIVRDSLPQFVPGLPASVSALSSLPVWLDCKADAYPEPRYTWYFPNNSAVLQNEATSVVSNGSLLISQTDKTLEGEYRCTAENRVGTATRRVKLIVTEPPDSGTKPEIPDLQSPDPVSSKPPTPSTGSLPADLVTAYSKDFPKTPKNYPKLTAHVEKVTRRHVHVPSKPVPDNPESNPVTGSSPTIPKNETHRKTDARKPKDVTKARTSSTHHRRISIVERPASRIHYSRRRFGRRRGQFRWPPADQPRPGSSGRYPSYRNKRVLQYYHSEYSMHDDRVYLNCETDIRTNQSNTSGRRRYIPPTNSWTLPSGLVYDRRFSRLAARKYILLGNGTLIIRSATLADAGPYKCISIKHDDTLEIITHVTLHVTVRLPFINEIMREYIQLKPGESTFLPCSAEGHPAPELTWTTPTGVSIHPGQWRRRLNAFYNGTLGVFDIQPDESGAYTCTATNMAGEKRRIVHITVAFYPPRFMHPRTRIEYVKEGGSIRIPCAASGSPAPTFSWTLPNSDEMKANQAVFQGHTRSPKMAVLSDGTLIINRANADDVGRYYCKAQNSLGRDTSLVIVRVFN